MSGMLVARSSVRGVRVMSSLASESITRKQKIKFATIVSVLGGPLGIVLFPFVYAKPMWFAERLFDNQNEDVWQTTIEDYA